MNNQKAGKAPDGIAAEELYKLNRSLMKLAMYSTAVGISGLLVAMVIFFIKPSPQNYAIYPDGRLVALTPTWAEMSPDQISNIVSTALLTGLRFDFKNADSQIAKISQFMSPQGYNNFVESIQGIKKQAIDNRYIVSADIVQPTIIGKSIVVDNVRRYRTSTVIKISLEGQNSRLQPVTWVAEGYIRRVPENENPRGFVIDGFLFKPYEK